MRLHTGMQITITALGADRYDVQAGIEHVASSVDGALVLHAVASILGRQIAMVEAGKVTILNATAHDVEVSAILADGRDPAAWKR